MFWDRLYELCKEHNIKPTPFVKQLGYSSSVVTKWKSGVLPTGKTLQQIADYFYVSVDYLLGKTNTKQNSPLAEAKGLSNEELELIELVKSLNEDEIKELSKFIDYIISKRE